MGYTCTGTAAICSLDTSTLLDSITNQDLSNREQRCFDHTRRLPARSRNQESEELRCPAAGDDGQPRVAWGGSWGQAKIGALQRVFFWFFFLTLALETGILRSRANIRVPVNQYRRNSHASAGHNRCLSFLVKTCCAPGQM